MRSASSAGRRLIDLAPKARCTAAPSVAASCSTSRLAGITWSARYSNRLAISEATHSPTVAQRSRVVREQHRKEVFKRGNIGREATEVLLMEALHNPCQRLWSSTFYFLSNT
ncbi:hypothetical protein D3C79_739580 [compost metagenome]